MISQYLGFDSDYIIIGLSAVVLILLILIIVNIAQMRKLKKAYKVFMSGKNGKNLEDTLIKRLDQVDTLLEANNENEKTIKSLFEAMQLTYQKMGLIKYDAFNEMGGKLSFSLAMLDVRNNGFIINAMHTREGCYTYIKEIVDGNSIIVFQQILPDCHRMALFAVKRPVYELHLRHLPVKEKLQLPCYQRKAAEPHFFVNRRQTVTTGKWTSTAALIVDNAVFQPA